MGTEGYPDDDTELFSAARAKVLRARQFVQELEEELAEYKKNDPLSAEIRPDLGHIEVKFKAITLKPCAIVGDTMHNLRSSLDLMASELARRNGKSDKDVYFPFSDAEGSLDDAIRRRSFNKAGHDAVVLLRKLKPYRGGNEALRAIHDLDIQDKHSALVLTTSKMQIEVAGSYHLDGLFKPLVKADLAAMRYMFGPDVPVFGGKGAIEVLHQLVELADGVLNEFSALVTKEASTPSHSSASACRPDSCP